MLLQAALRTQCWLLEQIHIKAIAFGADMALCHRFDVFFSSIVWCSRPVSWALGCFHHQLIGRIQCVLCGIKIAPYKMCSWKELTLARKWTSRDWRLFCLWRYLGLTLKPIQTHSFELKGIYQPFLQFVDFPGRFEQLGWSVVGVNDGNRWTAWSSPAALRLGIMKTILLQANFQLLTM